MLNNKEFRKEAHQLVDWMADFLETIEDLPVKSKVLPGSVISQLPLNAPEASEPFNKVFEDFKDIILPGITHWQHPNFHAYFPGNSSYPSLLGEMLTSTLAAQCMIWETSPAAAELEERVMDWLKNMLGLPQEWDGCIQDTASTATLAAMLSARERITNFKINSEGFSKEKLRYYCSTQTHSSIDKAIKVLGAGSNNLVKIAVDENMAMKPNKLKEAIEEDIASGFMPTAVVSAIGTTGTLAVDPLNEIGKICKEFDIWLHVDAAYAGTALLLPEFRWMNEGIELADSFVFNPHKWMFTNFDCTGYFVKDKEVLLKTFEILPEYLKTRTTGKVKDYRDWGIPLGRRFRALKLWFVIRDFGVKGIQKRLREHISYADWIAAKVQNHEDYELVTKPLLNIVCFRCSPQLIPEENWNQLNENILMNINDSGKAYLTHTKVNEIYTIRMVMGQTYLQQRHVEKTWDIILQMAEEAIANFDKG
jgi:aromatic-L-amino-acid decarboxylase